MNVFEKGGLFIICTYVIVQLNCCFGLPSTLESVCRITHPYLRLGCLAFSLIAKADLHAKQQVLGSLVDCALDY